MKSVLHRKNYGKNQVCWQSLLEPTCLSLWTELTMETDKTDFLKNGQAIKPGKARFSLPHHHSTAILKLAVLLT